MIHAACTLAGTRSGPRWRSPRWTKSERPRVCVAYRIRGARGRCSSPRGASHRAPNQNSFVATNDVVRAGDARSARARRRAPRRRDVCVCESAERRAGGCHPCVCRVSSWIARRAEDLLAVEIDTLTSQSVSTPSTPESTVHGEDRRRASGSGWGFATAKGSASGTPPRRGASEDDDEKLRRLAAKVALTRLRRVPGSPGATPGASPGSSAGARRRMTDDEGEWDGEYGEEPPTWPGPSSSSRDGRAVWPRSPSGRDNDDVGGGSAASSSVGISDPDPDSDSDRGRRTRETADSQGLGSELARSAARSAALAREEAMMDPHLSLSSMSGRTPSRSSSSSSLSGRGIANGANGRRSLRWTGNRASRAGLRTTVTTVNEASLRRRARTRRFRDPRGVRRGAVQTRSACWRRRAWRIRSPPNGRIITRTPDSESRQRR